MIEDLKQNETEIVAGGLSFLAIPYGVILCARGRQGGCRAEQLRLDQLRVILASSHLRSAGAAG